MLPIVIVDDSHEDALLAQRVFAHCKVQNPIIVLDSGKACLDYFSGAEPYMGRSVPCLLLLDLVMTPLSGLDVLDKLRSVPHARGSVLVMLSGLSEWRVVHEGYQLGAHTFLIKPLLVQDIMQMLNSVPALAINKLPDGYEISISGSAPAATEKAPGNRIDNTLTIQA